MCTSAPHIILISPGPPRPFVQLATRNYFGGDRQERRGIENLRRDPGSCASHCKALCGEGWTAYRLERSRATASKLATITQSPREFDFPNPSWPPTFHYAGPFHDDEGRQEIPFPWEKLTNKPLVYASLGTIVNGLDHVYRIILEAVGKFPEIQTVLSVGKNINPDVLGPIPPNVIVVSEAPQIELLKRATLCITHAGLNTTLESLAQGVPMVAIPIGYDQPGVAARIAYHGVGEFVEVGDLTADRLLELIQRVATNQDYRVRARYFRDVIAKTRGLDVAAEIIEQSLGASQISDPAAKPVELLPT